MSKLTRNEQNSLPRSYRRTCIAMYPHSYRTYAKAMDSISFNNRYNRSGGAPLAAFLCGVCQHWHITALHS